MSLAIDQRQEERSRSMAASDSVASSKGATREPIRVMIVDDHSVVVSGLRLALQYQGFEVVASAESADRALKLCLELEPDVLLLDIHMPREEGFGVLERVKSEDIKTEVIMLTASLRAEDRRRAAELGASGYVSKEIMPDQLGEIVRSVLEGKVGAEETHGASDLYEADTQPVSRGERLTEQELQVLRLIAQGKDNSEISDELFISVNTVKTHVGSLLSKLDVENRTQAAIWAIRHEIDGGK